MIAPQEVFYATSLFGCSAVAAFIDIRERRIPNKLVAFVLMLGLVLHLALGGVAQAAWSLIAALIAGSIFMVFYIAGGMGAGDVKLIAALAAMAGLADVKVLLIATVLAGAVLAIALALWRGAFLRTITNVSVLMTHHRDHGLTAHSELNIGNKDALRLPYAVPMAIASAWLLTSHFSGGVQ